MILFVTFNSVKPAWGIVEGSEKDSLEKRTYIYLRFLREVRGKWKFQDLQISCEREAHERSHFPEISGRGVHRFAGGSRLQEAWAYAGGEARAQLYDGHTINEKGKAVVSVAFRPSHCIRPLC